MNLFFKKHPALARFAAITALVIIFSYTLPRPVYAGAGLPFGGLIVWEYPCTCSPGTFMVYLSLPRPGIYAINPIILGPLLFLDKVVAPGSWLLGTYLPGVQSCLMYYGVTCAPFPVLGTISMTGTSL